MLELAGHPLVAPLVPLDAERNAAHLLGHEQGGAETGEGIEHPVARPGEFFRKRRARASGYLMSLPSKGGGARSRA